MVYLISCKTNSTKPYFKLHHWPLERSTFSLMYGVHFGPCCNFKIARRSHESPQLMSWQNDPYFADDIFKCVFPDEYDEFWMQSIRIGSCEPIAIWHYGDVIMGSIASQITSLMIVYSTVYLGAEQRKHQSSASLAFVRGIHRRPVNSPHKGPVTRKMFPFDDVIMNPCRTIFSMPHGFTTSQWGKIA